ncbi:hypothetical protein HPB50_008624 [Hyalomma asiaticum]|uniref:Uncharacterized protein n=1 Tax=Hyalomma asiaticum TaxID=266040 RepID=A0ACB7RZ67_HYAAI|nr:hypothetical protein HPB50_008624 [Hyalomma asiaticum]
MEDRGLMAAYDTHDAHDNIQSDTSLDEKLIRSKKSKKKKKNKAAKARQPKTITHTTEEPNGPVKGLKPSGKEKAIDKLQLSPGMSTFATLRAGVSNHLLCFMSDNATDKMQMPAEYCTHLVYRDVTLNKQGHNFEPAKNGETASFGDVLLVSRRTSSNRR